MITTKISNLPTQPTAFVGRENELAEITRLLSDPACRLLTLVGPGGIGKTRLALEAAGRQQPGFSYAIHLVPLQPLTSPDLIVSTIADTIGFQFYSGDDPKQQLFDYLNEKSLLLLLDNFEHLLDGVPLLSEILKAAPGVRLLVTSRERLNLVEEWVLDIGGLNYQTVDDDTHIENFSAVQLFVQRARQVQTQFSLMDHAGAVKRICRLVGGMPLGIELAAGWVRALSCQQIADEIERGLDILTTTVRNVPEKHRSMRIVFENSWTLLAEDEQAAFRKLSVFRGGFTRHAAEAVAGASLRILSALADKSLLRGDAAGRYDLHELLRQYSQEKLADVGEEYSIHKAHADYFGSFMEARERNIKFRRQNEALSEIERDFANIRSAWGWAMTNGDHQVISNMVGALNFFCDMKVRYVEGEEMFRAASECFASSQDPHWHQTYNRLRARRTRMIILGAQSHLFDAENLRIELETIVTENRTYDDPAETAFSLDMYAQVLNQIMGNFTPAVSYLEESFHIYKELNDSFYVAESLVFMSFCCQPGEDFLRQAIDLQRQIGDENGLSWSLMSLADMAFLDLGRFAESERYAQEALAIQRRRGDVKGLWAGMIYSGERYLSAGEFEKALAVAEECYQHALDMNIAPFKKAAQARLGLINILTEKDYQKGRRLCLECLSLSLPESSRLSGSIGSSPDVDTVFALAIMAYLENDLPATQSYYEQIIHHLPDWEPARRLEFLIPIALLILDCVGKTEQAVELTAWACHPGTGPGQSAMLWLDKWPLLNRLREKWEQQLGKEACIIVWLRGEKRNIAEIVTMLQNDLTQPFHPASISPKQALADPLTTRELEVLQLVADGLSNRQIAEHLVIAPGTVKWYMSEIFSKLGVNSRTQAVALARQLNLLS